MIITASQTERVPFCENAHVDMVDIEDIIDDPLGHIADPSGLAQRERLAVAYTKAVLADSNNLPDALIGEIHEHFTDPELVELTFLVGYINLLNLFNNSLGVRYHGDYRALLEPVTS